MTAILDATRAAFLADICTYPGDDGVRLIYADWLEEHGHVERAEFIRVQITLAGGDVTGERQELLAGRECDLLFLLHQEFKEELCGLRPALQPVRRGWIPLQTHGILYRGFLERLTCTWQELQRHAVCLFRRQPIQTVRLSRVQPASTQVDNATCWGWCQQMGGYSASLARPLFSRLPVGVQSYSSGWTFYASRKEALDALSHACVAYGRHIVGRPVA